MSIIWHQPHVGILGPGAIGQLIGFQLKQAGIHSIFVHHKTDSYCGTARFTDLHQLTHQYPVQAFPITDPKLTHLSLLIVCVKAYQITDAIKQISPHLSKHCHVLLLNNGLGPHEEVKKYLTTSHGLSLGTTSQGALKTESWSVIQSGNGLTQLGHFWGKPLNDDLKQALLNAIPNSEWMDKIILSLWYKLAVNVVINPLTATHSCQNGKLAEAHFQPTIHDIITEFMSVAACEHLNLQRDLIYDRINKVIQQTKLNYSSMQQDIAHHRPTEIEYINGYIVKMANKHHLPVPINQKLLESVRLLSQQEH